MSSSSPNPMATFGRLQRFALKPRSLYKARARSGSLLEYCQAQKLFSSWRGERVSQPPVPTTFKDWPNCGSSQVNMRLPIPPYPSFLLPSPD